MNGAEKRRGKPLKNPSLRSYIWGLRDKLGGFLGNVDVAADADDSSVGLLEDLLFVCSIPYYLVSKVR